MSFVAIIGAGDIGGAVARALVSRSTVQRVRLIDENGSVAAGKALDLLQSAPISRSDTRIDGATGIPDASGADVIVLADPSGGSEWAVDAGLAMFRRLRDGGHLDRSVVICAGAAHRSLMDRVFDDLKLPRRRIIGSAPEALAATARALVAIEARVASNQVTLTVIGKPIEKLVIPWSDASIAGHAVEAMLAPPQLRTVERRLHGLWPPGPSALGTAAALFAEAITCGSRRVVSAFVSLDRDNGTKAPVCAWPVSVGGAGVERITSPVLDPRHQARVDEVME